MHILYVHQYFGTPQGSSGTRSYEFARQLIARGHTVTMVCGGSERSDTTLAVPFKGGKREGGVDGIHVREYDISYATGDSILKRLRSFSRFAASATFDALFGRYDLIFTTSTPLTAALPGIGARWLRRKPFVFEVRDSWPELPKALGVTNPVLLGAMSTIEWLAYHSADRVIGLSPGIIKGIERRGVPRDKTVLISNGCDIDRFAAVPPLDLAQEFPEFLAKDDFVCTFTGAHGIANGLDALLDAAAELKRRGEAGIKFLLVGNGGTKPALMARAREENLDNIAFSDPMPKEKIFSLLKASDVGLQILKNVPAFYDGTSPNKFFDYLAAGIPIAVNYPGWMAKLVEDNDCGVAVPPDDPGAFADALQAARMNRDAFRAKGRNSLDLGRSRFDRDEQSAIFASTLEAVAQEPRGFYRAIGKRLLDLTAGAILLVLLSPVLLVTALLVAVRIGRPVLFRQTRAGKGGAPFQILKFRSMTNELDDKGELLPDADRLTRFGRFLRASSLDELPGLWNVLKGNMSLVGPRPLLMQYLPRYSKRQARRHEVLPGITGWAQVNGRNALSWEEKFDLDVWYVENQSLLTDLKILFRTVAKVFDRSGISSDGHATMPEFQGSPETSDPSVG